jgi:hypothetical protein
MECATLQGTRTVTDSQGCRQDARSTSRGLNTAHSGSSTKEQAEQAHRACRYVARVACRCRRRPAAAVHDIVTPRPPLPLGIYILSSGDKALQGLPCLLQLPLIQLPPVAVVGGDNVQ